MQELQRLPRMQTCGEHAAKRNQVEIGQLLSGVQWVFLWQQRDIGGRACLDGSESLVCVAFTALCSVQPRSEECSLI